LKTATLVLVVQAISWFCGGIYRIWTDVHEDLPDYHHDHDHCIHFVVISAVLSLWYCGNIFKIATTSSSLKDTTWAYPLLGLPPVALAATALLIAVVTVLSYSNHDEVIFQSTFEIGCGFALFTIAVYFFIYVHKGLQYSWIRSWLSLNGIFLVIHANVLNYLKFETDKYIAYASLGLFLIGYYNLPPVHVHQL